MRRHVFSSALTALIGAGTVHAEPLIAVDFVFVNSGAVPAYGDDFDDGLLGPEWFVAGGSPGPEHDSVLDMNLTDHIVNTTPIPTDAPVTIAALLSEDLGPTDFVFLVLYAEDLNDWFAVGLTSAAVFATDENLAPLFVDGYIGPDVGFKMIYDPASGILTATANDTLVWQDSPQLEGGVYQFGIFVIPEPAALPLLVFGAAWLLLPRRKTR